MRLLPTALPGVLLLEPEVHHDARGSFFELWRAAGPGNAPAMDRFVQDNVAVSRRGVLRGLHFQSPAPQAKLVTVLHGEIFDVAVDLRRDSPTLGRWAGVRLSAERPRQLYIPEGFAHGYVVTGESAVVHYKATAYWRAEFDRALRWDDPAIGIEWPVERPVLSARDAAAPRLAEIPPALLHPAVPEIGAAARAGNG